MPPHTTRRFNVVVDTSVLTRSPARTDLHFQALARLCNAGVAHLHVPHIVRLEFISQEVARAKTSLSQASNQLLGLERCGSMTAQNPQLQAIRGQLAALQGIVIEKVSENFDAWLASLPGTLQPLLLPDASAAWDAYAFARPPFKEPRLRKDLPDAFIYQIVASLSKTHPIVVIAHDDNLASYCSQLPSCEVQRSLELWISSPPVQTALLDLSVIDTLATYVAIFQRHDATTGAFSQQLKSGRLADLYGQVITSPTIPDDNNAACISSWEDPAAVSIDFANLHYFGGGDFGLPFSFRTSALADYYIYKADYYTLPEELSPPVTDHNDHYFAAESEYCVIVQGLAKLSFDPDDLRSIESALTAGHFELEVDSIESVEVDE